MENRMRAVAVTPGGICLEQKAVPKPGAGQVLVRVYAAGLNRVDLIMAEAVRRGNVARGHDPAPGREFSGYVAETGENVTGFKPGDPVMGSGRATLAEYTVADKDLVTRVPEGALDMEAAAVLPVALNTMHDALVTRGRLGPGQSVLVQGASSGVGLMALQIAEYLGAAPVIGTSRDAARREKLSDFGADMALDPTDPSWVEQVLEATDQKGVNLVIDQVGAPVANENMRASALEGRIINVGRLGGSTGTFDFDLHAYKRITYTGVTFRTRTLEEIRQVVRRRQADLSEALARGRLKLPVDSVFPLERAEEAFSRMKQNLHFGKIVIRT